jgi:hypothetical protein
MSDEFVVNGLPLPPLLISLLREGRWKHPGHMFLQHLMPTLKEKVEFIGLERIGSFIEAQFEFAEHPFLSPRWRYACGSKSATPLALPWLDLEKAVDIAEAVERGADTLIVLDYRTSISDPRVLTNEWGQDGNIWYEMDPTFTEFVARLGL